MNHIYNRKYKYLYKITNNINKRYYIGVRVTDRDPNKDFYFGSGVFIKQAIKKYGKKNFTKEILMYFDNIDDMYNKEKEIVNVEFIKRRNTYNMEVGGSGGKIWTKEMRENMSRVQIERIKTNGSGRNDMRHFLKIWEQKYKDGEFTKDEYEKSNNRKRNAFTA